MRNTRGASARVISARRSQRRPADQGQHHQFGLLVPGQHRQGRESDPVADVAFAEHRQSMLDGVNLFAEMGRARSSHISAIDTEGETSSRIIRSNTS